MRKLFQFRLRSLLLFMCIVPLLYGLWQHSEHVCGPISGLQYYLNLFTTDIRGK